MSFKIWLENEEEEIVAAAVLNSIPGYAGSGEDGFWLRKRVLDYFPHSSDIRKELLKDSAVKNMVGGRNAVEYIKTFNVPKGPTFQEFINWIKQKNLT